MKKTASYVQIILFTAFIGVFFLLFWILPDTGFSEQENRELTQLPKFSLDSVFSGTYSTKFESFSADQFPMRDSWTTLKAAAELFSGKKENKGVYLCEGGTLIEGYSAPDPKLLDTNINAVASLAESVDVPVYFCLIPGIAGVRPDLVPKNAPNDSQLENIEYCYENSGAINIDMYSALNARAEEYIYYRTDHHWTSLGAFYGYEAITRAMGNEPAPISSFERETVTDEFYGTIYSKSGMSWVAPDSIEIFNGQSAGVEVFNYVTGEAEASALYDYTFLEKKDKYSMFLGGISPLIKVSSGNSEAPALLILRDSYTDSLIQFMQDDFSEIHIMDLRYYKTRLYNTSVAEYVRLNGIDAVLVCYSLNNFGTDANVFLMG